MDPSDDVQAILLNRGGAPLLPGADLNVTPSRWSVWRGADASLVTRPDLAKAARAIFIELAGQCVGFLDRHAQAGLVMGLDAADVAFRAILGDLAVDPSRLRWRRCGRRQHHACQRAKSNYSNQTDHTSPPFDSLQIRTTLRLLATGCGAVDATT
jgi:hypothetical protein